MAAMSKLERMGYFGPSLTKMIQERKAAGREFCAVNASKVSKSKKNKPTTLKLDKAKPRREHQLSAMFSAGIAASRDNIVDSTSSTIDAVIAKLNSEAINISGRFGERETAIFDEMMQVTSPFKDTELDWSSADGHTGTVTINNRMKKLEKIIDTEETALAHQWQEWNDVEDEIEQLIDQFSRLSGHDLTETDYYNSVDVFGRMVEEAEAEIEKDKACIAKMIDDAKEDSKKAMEENEKVFDIKEKKMQEHLWALIRDME
ncbi:hypothetical protein ACLMJK_007236 [Lecanora helva]